METCFDLGVGKLHDLRRERDTDDYAALPRSPPSAPSSREWRRLNPGCVIDCQHYGWDRNCRSNGQTLLFNAERFPGRLSQVVVHDFAEAESEIGAEVDCGNDIENRQFGDGRQGVRSQA